MRRGVRPDRRPSTPIADLGRRAPLDASSSATTMSLAASFSGRSLPREDLAVLATKGSVARSDLATNFVNS